VDNVKRRILVVDDDIDLSQTIQYILEKGGGYHVRVENISTKTIDAIYEFRPELILLDVTMPELDGFEVCKRIKTDKIFSFIKIIFVSGNITKEDRLRGYEAGADDYITKPFENEELLAKVGVYLKLKYTEEMSQMKSNILSLIQNESTGPFTKILNLFKRKTIGDDSLIKAGTWRALARKGASKVFNYANNALFLCEIMNGVSLAKKSVLIDEVIEEALRKVKRVATAKRISFFIKEKGKMRYGELDTNLMTRAFVCVLNNVIMHSPKSQKYVILINCDHPEVCEVYIQDSGHKIDKKKFDELFNEFIEFNPQENDRGQDLSIALARRIAQLHRGNLSFQTDYEDSYFWVFHIPFFESKAAIDPRFY